MAENTKKSEKGGDEILLAKLERMEADILEIDRIRSQQTIVARVGLVLIFVAVIIFAINMYRLYSKVTSDENLELLAQAASKDMQELFENDANLQAFKTDLTGRVFPAVSKQVMDRFIKEVPVFRQKGEQLLLNLKVHVEDSLRTKLTDELDSSLKEIEQEIIKKYPNLSVEKLDMVFKQVEPLFLENITNMVESKIELVGDDLDEMEKTLDKFRVISDDMKLGEQERDKVENAVFENLLELGIYHLNPEKGDLPADVMSATSPTKVKPLVPAAKNAPINKGGAK